MIRVLSDARQPMIGGLRAEGRDGRPRRVYPWLADTLDGSDQAA